MSPENVMVWAENIAAVLGALDPPNAEAYSIKAARYTEELEELDNWIARKRSAMRFLRCRQRFPDREPGGKPIAKGTVETAVWLKADG